MIDISEGDSYVLFPNQGERTEYVVIAIDEYYELIVAKVDGVVNCHKEVEDIGKLHCRNKGYIFSRIEEIFDRD